MNSLKINNREWLLVEVSESAKIFEIWKDSPSVIYIYEDESCEFTDKVTLPPGNYGQPIKVSEATEEQTAAIVDRFSSSWGTKYYPEYPLEKIQGSRRTKPGFDRAIESLYSLVRSQGMKPGETVIIEILK